jgi:DNA polymerase I-like protein with 3'-5' exonuclease and polymerase domains
MLIINTSTDDLNSLSAAHTYWAYNGLDCCITHEVMAQTCGAALAETPVTYNFERAMQAPALAIMRQGILVDMVQRDKMMSRLAADRERLEHILNRLGQAVWGQPLNANSPTQLKSFFYDVMKLPVQFKIERGARIPSTNRECLEKLQPYLLARPIVNTILALRDTVKLLGVLRSGIDADHRMYFGVNVAGTETGRWSSNRNSFGGGTNGQNITEGLRRIFRADDGYKIAYIDLEQAESRDVGVLSWVYTGHAGYLNACESGDLHTLVAKMVWPNLAWTGDAKADKAVAEQKCYRDFSYRDLAKRGGHGSNYYGRPPTMARHLKVATSVMAHFQENYFTRFPGIPAWHQWTAEQLHTQRALTTPFGRRRCFWGRPYDDATLREAIANVPQSMVGDRLNLGMWRIWKRWGHIKHRGKPVIQLLLQIHDAVLLQYQQCCESWIIPELLKCIEIPITFRCIAPGTADFGKTRTITIPAEAMVGWNWGKAVLPDELLKKYGDLATAAKKRKEPNPHGLMKYKGVDTRSAPVYHPYSILDRVL